MADKVVEFKPKAPDKTGEYPATVKPRDYSGCQHPGTIVSEEERTLVCKTCQAVLDPIAVIAQWARSWDLKRWDTRRDVELDVWVGEFHKIGGRIAVRPSGVVVEHEGRRWASACSGGLTAQLHSALSRARQDLRGGWNPPAAELLKR